MTNIVIRYREREKGDDFLRAIFREAKTKLDLGWTERMKEKARKVVMSLYLLTSKKINKTPVEKESS